MPCMLQGMLTQNQSPLAKQVGQAPHRAVDLVVIHCSATPSGKPLHQGTPGAPGYLNAAQVINVWHAARGFRRQPPAVRAFNPLLPSIGYHFVIDLTGEVWTGRGLDEIGAHVAGFNAHSVGVCMVGGIELNAKYTPAQWKSLEQVVNMLLADYRIPCTAPKRLAGGGPAGFSVTGGVCGHRDLSPDLNGDGVITSSEWLKTCPGFDVRAWLARGMRPDPSQIFQETQA